MNSRREALIGRSPASEPLLKNYSFDLGPAADNLCVSS